MDCNSDMVSVKYAKCVFQSHAKFTNQVSCNKFFFVFILSKMYVLQPASVVSNMTHTIRIRNLDFFRPC